jgi:hypothetical protein
MDMPRLSKSVRQITVLQRDQTGTVAPVVVFKRRRGKKKGTKYVRPFEKAVRSLTEASDATTGTYLRRHKKSNRKRRDGWVRDIANNVVKANNKGLKELKPAALLGL